MQTGTYQTQLFRQKSQFTLNCILYTMSAFKFGGRNCSAVKIAAISQFRSFKHLGYIQDVATLIHKLKQHFSDHISSSHFVNLVSRDVTCTKGSFEWGVCVRPPNNIPCQTKSCLVPWTRLRLWLESGITLQQQIQRVS